MKTVVINEKKSRQKELLIYFIDWLIRMIGYALVLVLVSFIFKKTFYIDHTNFGLWALLASILLYTLNKTVKPIIVWLTLPITGLTLGLFYPFINVIILNLTDLILGTHFNIKGLFMSVIVAIVISLLNIIMDSVLKKLLKKGEV